MKQQTHQTSEVCKTSEVLDSGVAWLEEVPEHWEVKRLKFFSDIILGKMLTSEDKGGFFHRPYLRAKNLNWLETNLSDVKNMWFSARELDIYRLERNDLLVSEGGEVGRTCIWSNELDECYIQNSVNRVRIENHNHPRFFLYQFYAAGYKGYFDSIVNRVSIAHLTKEKLAEVTFVCPPLPEQTAVANYLDRKTTQIDTVITKKERLIALLREERTALISHAVTKGLNPNAPMKDSGIAWLGEVPEHWEVKRVKYLAEVNRAALTEQTDPEYEFYYVDIGNVTLGEISENISKIKFENAPSRARRILRKGDTIVSTVRTYLKAIAYFSLDGDKYIASTGFAVLSPKSINEHYFAYLMMCEKIVDTISSLSVGVSYPAVNASDVANIPVWYPPDFEEQIAIADYLDRKTAQIDQRITRIEKQITLLQEYRTALISAVVTGKMDVR